MVLATILKVRKEKKVGMNLVLPKNVLFIKESCFADLSVCLWFCSFTSVCFLVISLLDTERPPSTASPATTSAGTVSCFDHNTPLSLPWNHKHLLNFYVCGRGLFQYIGRHHCSKIQPVLGTDQPLFRPGALRTDIDSPSPKLC